MESSSDACFDTCSSLVTVVSYLSSHWKEPEEGVDALIKNLHKHTLPCFSAFFAPFLQEKLFPIELNIGALGGSGSSNCHLLVHEGFQCHLKLVKMATTKSVHELFVKECPPDEKKEMVLLTATFTVTVALAAPEGEQVKSPESDRVRCVTCQYYT